MSLLRKGVYEGWRDKDHYADSRLFFLPCNDVTPIVEIIGFYYTEAIFLVFTFPWEAVFMNITLEFAKRPDKRRNPLSG
jgi:hypothetical protein